VPAPTTIAEIQRIHLSLLGATAALAAVTSMLSPWGILFGGAVVALNLWLLQRLLYYLFSKRPSRMGPVIALGLAKQLLLLGLLGLLFWRVDVDAVAFALGVSLLVVACVTAAVWTELRAVWA
jgi:FtsH-binding integral membrane protein